MAKGTMVLSTKNQVIKYPGAYIFKVAPMIDCLILNEVIFMDFRLSRRLVTRVKRYKPTMTFTDFSS